MAAMLTIVISPCLAKNHRILMKFGKLTQQQIYAYEKFKMADGRYIANRFSAMTEQPIIRFQ